jgi:hypothetical protein
LKNSNVEVGNVKIPFQQSSIAEEMSEVSNSGGNPVTQHGQNEQFTVPIFIFFEGENIAVVWLKRRTN